MHKRLCGNECILQIESYFQQKISSPQLQGFKPTVQNIENIGGLC